MGYDEAQGANLPCQSVLPAETPVTLVTTEFPQSMMNLFSRGLAIDSEPANSTYTVHVSLQVSPPSESLSTSLARVEFSAAGIVSFHMFPAI
jgi:hypothetical protein